MDGNLVLTIVALYATVLVLGLANTVGYHRLLTDRSFQTAPWLRGTLTLLAAQCPASACTCGSSP